MAYLISSVDTYRIQSVEEVEKFHEDLTNDPHFILGAFAYKTKQVKSKGEVIDEYQLVTVKKLFNNEKEPEDYIKINYEVE